jgi:hypothetical protein
MRGREKMTFVILRHSIGSAWLLSGVQCPFYLSLVDSDCVRRDSAYSFNEYVNFDALLFFEIKPVWLSQKIFVTTFWMSGTYAMTFFFYRRQILQHFVLCKFQLESVAMTKCSI